MLIRLSLLCVSLVVAGCTAREPAAAPGGPAVDKEPAPETLRIAVVQGQGDAVRGARLAVEVANATGALGGRPVELVVTQPSDETATYSAEVAALVISADVEASRTAASMSAATASIVVVAGKAAPQLVAGDQRRVIFASCGDQSQAVAAAEWAIRDLGARSALTLFNAGENKTSRIHSYFENRFGELGGRVLGSYGYAPGEVQRLPSSVRGVDLVYLVARSAGEAAAVGRQLRTIGYRGVILGGDIFDAPSVWAAEREAEKVYFTAHAYLGSDNPDPRVVSFRRAYSQAYGGAAPDVPAALTFDATSMIVTAAASASSLDADAIAEELGRTENYDGVTGTIRFRPGSGMPNKSIAIMGVESGKVGFVRQFEPITAPSR